MLGNFACFVIIVQIFVFCFLNKHFSKGSMHITIRILLILHFMESWIQAESRISLMWMLKVARAAIYRMKQLLTDS